MLSGVYKTESTTYWFK